MAEARVDFGWTRRPAPTPVSLRPSGTVSAVGVDRNEGGLSDLLDLLTRPDWHALASCRAFPELSWFTAQGEPIATQKAICGACRVRAECEAAGLAERDGVWGGLSPRERATLRRGAA